MKAQKEGGLGPHGWREGEGKAVLKESSLKLQSCDWARSRTLAHHGTNTWPWGGAAGSAGPSSPLKTSVFRSHWKHKAGEQDNPTVFWKEPSRSGITTSGRKETRGKGAISDSTMSPGKKEDRPLPIVSERANI